MKKPTVEAKIEPVEIDINHKINEFRTYYDDNYDYLLSASEVFKTLISALIVDSAPSTTVSFRIKEREECIDKFKRKYQKPLEEKAIDFQIKDHITDIIGLRIVCLYNDEIKLIQTHIEENFKRIEITDKISQLESTEDKFGYKGLHLDLMLNEQRNSLPEYSKFKDIQFELQIRTVIQDAWSILDHKIKYKKNIPTELKRGINRLSALFEIADEEFLRIKGVTQQAQQKAQTEITSGSKELEEQINVFKFIIIAQEHFPSYHFIEYKADGFVGDLLNLEPKFSTKDLIEALQNNKEAVEEYALDTHSYMNPYTVIRHCIYLLDKNKYKSLLYDSQIGKFEKNFKL
ncbi:(p)ppGpp synthetase [Hymenobacter aquaticus]|uniref:(P)ppGpp synthetase n=1 Tax=Hymenobacter aquaticus TaxID=1867101 RepID=A0A4Z0Q5S5_9BACT|nr:(p)ppGpp synthetase [Hymenobacter aquaticus]TGE24503.1 (p)ppGpp synthetase [Hymenobacter aquaticus]